MLYSGESRDAVLQRTTRRLLLGDRSSSPAVGSGDAGGRGCTTCRAPCAACASSASPRAESTADHEWCALLVVHGSNGAAPRCPRGRDVSAHSPRAAPTHPDSHQRQRQPPGHSDSRSALHVALWSDQCPQIVGEERGGRTLRNAAAWAPPWQARAPRTPSGVGKNRATCNLCDQSYTVLQARPLAIRSPTEGVSTSARSSASARRRTSANDRRSRRAEASGTLKRLAMALRGGRGQNQVHLSAPRA